MKSASSPIKREETETGSNNIQRPSKYSTLYLNKDGSGTKTKNGSPPGASIVVVTKTQFMMLMLSHLEQQKLESTPIELIIIIKMVLGDMTGGSRRCEDFLNHCKIKS